MAGRAVYLLIFLMPSPRLEIQTLAGYRLVTSQMAVAASCHVAVSQLVTSAHRLMNWVQGRFDPRPLDIVPSGEGFLRVRLIPPVGAVRPLRHTPFHSPADDAVQYKLTASWKWRVASAVTYRHNVWRFSSELARITQHRKRGVASVPYRANNSIKITCLVIYLLTYLLHEAESLRR
jgi:hypothetical protein